MGRERAVGPLRLHLFFDTLLHWCRHMTAIPQSALGFGLSKAVPFRDLALVLQIGSVVGCLPALHVLIVSGLSALLSTKWNSKPCVLVYSQPRCHHPTMFSPAKQMENASTRWQHTWRSSSHWRRTLTANPSKVRQQATAQSKTENARKM